MMGLEAAVEAAAEFLNKAVKPVLVGGQNMRVAKACDAFVELADRSGYAVAVMPAAKGLVPEHHPHFLGTYWGAVSTPFVLKLLNLLMHTCLLDQFLTTIALLVILFFSRKRKRSLFSLIM